LRLAQEFVQDGYYKFAPAEFGTVAANASGAMRVSGTIAVVPEGGNKGSLGATLHFDPQGKLTKVAEENKVIRGMRPRCQATLLLDPNPLVREIAEQDLLVLGRAAEGYLRTQRARANPELQKVIDRIWKQIVEEGR
jgi:hypothetical protein